MIRVCFQTFHPVISVVFVVLPNIGVYSIKKGVVSNVHLVVLVVAVVLVVTSVKHKEPPS